jgi:FixJ family two-component response regulator
MQVRKTYEQLHAEERFVIAREVLQGASVRSVARKLNRSPSTISRGDRPQPRARFHVLERQGSGHFGTAPALCASAHQA